MPVKSKVTSSVARVVGAVGTNLGAAQTITFNGAEEVWLVGVVNTALTVTLQGRVAGSKLVFLATQNSAGGNSVAISDGTTPANLPVTTIGNALIVARAYCPNSTDIDLEPNLGIDTIVQGAAATNFGATQTIDFQSKPQEIDLTGVFNSNLAVTVNNPVAGSLLRVLGKQDATGSRTLTVAGQAITIPGTASTGTAFVEVVWTDATNFWVNSAGISGAAVSISYAGGTGMSATNVEAAIDELADEKADKIVNINNQTGTTYTLALSDASSLVRVSNAATHTLTVPPNSAVPIPVGSVTNVARVGAGAVNVAAGAGVTINSPGGLLGLRVQYSQATLIKTATDTWLLGGDLA